MPASAARTESSKRIAAFCVRDELRDLVDIAFLTAQERWTLGDLAAIAEEKFGLRTISEEKLLTEFLRKRELFHPLPPELFLREGEEHVARAEKQIENLLQTTTL